MRTPMVLVRSTQFVAGLCGLMVANADAARHVPAKITVDGVIVLKGSTGDNGSPDADEVWNYLKTMTFEPTAEFATLGIGADARNATLTSQAPVGEWGRIEVDIDYGGTVMTRTLKIVRVPKDEYGREWKIEPADVAENFDDRLIRRDHAARLKDVKRTE